MGVKREISNLSSKKQVSRSGEITMKIEKVN
jgi:hypothetical protein